MLVLDIQFLRNLNREKVGHLNGEQENCDVSLRSTNWNFLFFFLLSWTYKIWWKFITTIKREEEKREIQWAFAPRTRWNHAPRSNVQHFFRQLLLMRWKLSFKWKLISKWKMNVYLSNDKENCLTCTHSNFCNSFTHIKLMAYLSSEWVAPSIHFIILIIMAHDEVEFISIFECHENKHSKRTVCIAASLVEWHIAQGGERKEQRWPYEICMGLNLRLCFCSGKLC